MNAREAAIAAVLAEHWSYEPARLDDAWLCECGAQIMGALGDTDAAQQAHAAAIVAALDTPADTTATLLAIADQGADRARRRL